MSDRRPAPTHQAQAHRRTLAGVEAVALLSARSFPRHAHDQLGIGVIHQGAQRSWSGMGAVEAGPGDVIMVNPGELHDGMPLGGGPRAWRMVYLDAGLAAAAAREAGVDPAALVPPVARDPLLARRFARLFDCLADSAADPLAREEALFRCLALALRRHALAPPRSPGRSPTVTRALRRLEEAPAEPITLAELAALAGTGRFQLLRGFAREVGTTPHAYLVQRRVLLARRLLAAGMGPAEAALEAGFADQSHLTRAFVRQLGLTPARYRAAVC